MVCCESPSIAIKCKKNKTAFVVAIHGVNVLMLSNNHNSGIKSMYSLGFMRWCVCLTFACMVVTAQNNEPHPINSAQEFVELFHKATGTFVATNVVLKQDIIFDTTTSTQLPIGSMDDGSCVEFSGTLDGNNHTIKQITMNNGKDKRIGLFCSVAKATITNLVIDESNTLNGLGGGALAALIDGGGATVVNVHTAASITCVANNCGGLIGSISCGDCVVEFDDCSNTGFINSTTNTQYCSTVGGLVGQVFGVTNESVMMRHCSNNGMVEANCLFSSTTQSSEVAGGLMGRNEAPVQVFEDCNNTGDISCSSTMNSCFVGGIVGRTSSSNSINMINNINTGEISTTQCVKSCVCGGIVGSQVYGELNIISSMNKGTVTSSSTSSIAGGIIGSQSGKGAVVLNCVNHGNISGAGAAHGIGETVSSASNVVSAGVVEALGSNTQTHATWQQCSGSCDVNVFVVEGVCDECATNAITIHWNTTTQSFHDDGGEGDVSVVLNKEVASQCWSMGWSNTLELVHVEQLCSSTSSPSSQFVGEVHEVVIKIEVDKTDDINEANITSILEGLGVDVVITRVEIIVENGKVTSIVVSVDGDKEAAQSLADAINKAKDSENCSAGVLCHATDVFVGDEPSGAHGIEVSLALMVLLVVHTLGCQLKQPA